MQGQKNLQTDPMGALFTPATPNELVEAKLADLILRFQVLTEQDKDYVEYLNQIKQALTQLGKNQREIEDELDKIELRKTLRNDT